MFDRLAALRRDFDRLGELLEGEVGAAAAALARERRLIGSEIAALSKGGKGSPVDELAVRRGKGQRRRKSAGDRR